MIQIKQSRLLATILGFAGIVIYPMLLVSCKAPEIITERIVTDTTIIREVPKIVTIPGQSAQSPSVNLDSLVRVIQSGISPQVINRTLHYTDPETNMRVGLLLDELGNLSALCETQDQTIQLLEREIERIRSDTKTTTIIHHPSFWEKLKTSIPITIITILLIAVAYIFLRLHRF
jgi:hypothetical protein